MSLDDLEDADSDEERQLKVTVEARTLIQLRSRKVLTGDTYSTQVLDALEWYFRSMDD